MQKDSNLRKSVSMLSWLKHTDIRSMLAIIKLYFIITPCFPTAGGHLA